MRDERYSNYLLNILFTVSRGGDASQQQLGELNIIILFLLILLLTDRHLSLDCAVVRKYHSSHLDQSLAVLEVADTQVVQLGLVQIFQQCQVLVAIEHKHREVVRHVQGSQDVSNAGYALLGSGHFT